MIPAPPDYCHASPVAPAPDLSHRRRIAILVLQLLANKSLSCMKYRKLVLYHFPFSRSARVLWALHETVGEDFEVRSMQLYKGEQYSKAFLEKNPNHNVPLLEITGEDGGVHRMLESVAMIEWLVDAFPDKALSPPVALSLQRADYLQMLHFGGTWMDMMLWQIRVQEHLLPPDQSDERTIKRYRDKFVDEVEPQLLARLEAGPYICGEAFSAADIVIGHNVQWAQAYELCQDDRFTLYLSGLAKRPAFVKAFADAGEFTLRPPARQPSVDAS
jgi:glutathione S-transferase